MPASAPGRGQTLPIAALLAAAGLFSAPQALALLSILALWVPEVTPWKTSSTLSSGERRCRMAEFTREALYAPLAR